MQPLFQFGWLLAVHFVGDFVLQSQWMADNKSRDLGALAQHVTVYTGTLAVGTLLLFAGRDLVGAFLCFVAANGVLHFATDYATSRWSKLQSDPHNRAVVMGVDQLVHTLTLLATGWWLLWRD